MGQIAATCNAVAMSFLQRGREDQCMELLRRAVDLTEVTSDVSESDPVRVKLRAVTYNNIGCYYRKMEQPKEALLNLERALTLLEKTREAEHVGDTHLNMCAILSQIGRHAEALEHAQIALILLQEELYFMTTYEANGSSKSTRAPVDNTSRYGVLSIAYHNIAVEQEYLGRIEDCILSYHKAHELSLEKLGHAHPVSIALASSFENAKKTWSKQPATKKLDRPVSANSSKARSMASSKSSSSAAKKKYAKSTTSDAIARLSKGHPSARAPVRPKSASHAAIKRREMLSGSKSSRSARQAVASQADQMYTKETLNNSCYSAHHVMDEYADQNNESELLDMLTPRGMVEEEGHYAELCDNDLNDLMH